MRTDIYLNALRAVFGYALTCHKSQGGEWEHVYLDIPRNFPLNPTPGTYQWLYTAMTRAKTQLYITEGFWLL
jgi:ATP-dependent exoDNAse (exonuclease V) alpha subunit